MKTLLILMALAIAPSLHAQNCGNIVDSGAINPGSCAPPGACNCASNHCERISITATNSSCCITSVLIQSNIANPGACFLACSTTGPGKIVKGKTPCDQAPETMIILTSSGTVCPSD